MKEGQASKMPLKDECVMRGKLVFQSITHLV